MFLNTGFTIKDFLCVIFFVPPLIDCMRGVYKPAFSVTTLQQSALLYILVNPLFLILASTESLPAHMISRLSRFTGSPHLVTLMILYIFDNLLLAIHPFKGNFSLDFSAMDFLEFHGFLFCAEIRGKILQVLKIHSKLHIANLQFVLLIDTFTRIQCIPLCGYT